MIPRSYGIPLLIVAVAAFAYGLTGLFRDRFEAGDIYPAYSTLRSDPMGCRALYAALRHYPGVRVSQVLSEDAYRTQGKNSVFFFLGEPSGKSGFQSAAAIGLDSLVRAGNRVVLAFAPKTRISDSDERAEEEPEASADSAKDSTLASAKDSIASAEKSNRANGFSTRKWGYRLALDTATREDASANAVGNGRDTLPWVSDLYFDSLESPWTVVFRHNSLPVIVERPLGKGSLVLIADSYWASNEALFHVLPGRLLSFLTSDRRQLFFDERHLGLHQEYNLVNLLVRYRLHKLLPSLLLLFLAYLWKLRAGSDLVDNAGASDPTETEKQAAKRKAVEKKAAETKAGSGMLGLLHRNIQADALLENCYAQWKETEGKNSAIVSRVEGEVREILAAKNGAQPATLIADYRKIQGLINKRKSK